MSHGEHDDVVPLTGADCFLRAFEAEVRRTAKASHASQLVLRLGPGFDIDAFRRLVEEVSLANPVLRSPIRRSALLGPPVYRVDRARPAPGVAVHVHTAVDARADASAPAGAPPLGALPHVFFRRLNDRFDARRGRLMCFDIVPRGGARPGTDVAMTWLHMLLDGSGSELFVEHLAACSADPSHQRSIPITRAAGNASSPAVAQLPAASGARGRMAQAWNRNMLAMAGRPPTSLAGPLRRVRQDLRYTQLHLETDAATRAMDRAKKSAGFLTPMLFFLAVSIRAHQAVADRRGRSPQSWVVPLPVNLRPKGSQGEVFRTHVSLLWFQVTPDQTRDMAVLVEALKVQRLAAIRAGMVEAGVAAMEFARYAPSRVYSYMARRNFRGELASFFFAYTGQFASAAQSLCGAGILDGFHAPAVPPSPGSALVFCQRGSEMNVIHVHQGGSIDAAELDVMRAQILQDLEGA